MFAVCIHYAILCPTPGHMLLAERNLLDSWYLIIWVIRVHTFWVVSFSVLVVLLCALRKATSPSSFLAFRCSTRPSEIRCWMLFATVPWAAPRSLARSRGSASRRSRSARSAGGESARRVQKNPCRKVPKGHTKWRASPTMASTPMACMLQHETSQTEKLPERSEGRRDSWYSSCMMLHVLVVIISTVSMLKQSSSYKGYEALCSSGVCVCVSLSLPLPLSPTLSLNMRAYINTPQNLVLARPICRAQKRVQLVSGLAQKFFDRHGGRGLAFMVAA